MKCPYCRMRIENMNYNRCPYCGGNIEGMHQQFDNKNISKSTKDTIINPHNLDFNKSLKVIIMYYMIIYLGAFIIQLILMSLYQPIYNLPLMDGDNLSEQANNFIGIWSQILVYISLASVIIFYLKDKIIIDLKQLKNSAFLKKALLLVLIGYALMWMASILLGVFYRMISLEGDPSNQEAIIAMLNYSDKLPVVLVIIVIVLIGPIIEELVFRKAFFGLLSRFNINNIFKIFISALLFGALHVFVPIIKNLALGDVLMVGAELLFGIEYFLMGAIFASIYVKSNENIIPVVAIHIINNLLSVIFLFT